MAVLYKVKIKSLDLNNKSLTLHVKVVHPDAMYFSENLGFALRLLHDSVRDGAELGKHMNHERLSNAVWLAQNARCFLAGCELKEVRAPQPVRLKSKGGYQYWYDDTDELAYLETPAEVSATLVIHTTSEAWLAHLTAKSNWDSTAYDEEVNFLPCVTDHSAS